VTSSRLARACGARRSALPLFPPALSWRAHGAGASATPGAIVITLFNALTVFAAAEKFNVSLQCYVHTSGNWENF